MQRFLSLALLHEIFKPRFQQLRTTPVNKINVVGGGGFNIKFKLKITNISGEIALIIMQVKEQISLLIILV